MDQNTSIKAKLYGGILHQLLTPNWHSLHVNLLLLFCAGVTPFSLISGKYPVQVARNIFELGLKKYIHEPAYVLEWAQGDFIQLPYKHIYEVWKHSFHLQSKVHLCSLVELLQVCWLLVSNEWWPKCTCTFRAGTQCSPTRRVCWGVHSLHLYPPLIQIEQLVLSFETQFQSILKLTYIIQDNSGTTYVLFKLCQGKLESGFWSIKFPSSSFSFQAYAVMQMLLCCK